MGINGEWLGARRRMSSQQLGWNGHANAGFGPDNLAKNYLFRINLT
jgi:hypothetical protein